MCLPEIVVPSAQIEIEFILLSNWPDAHPTPTHEMPVDSVPTVRISEYGGVPCYFGKNSILVRDNWWWDEDLIFNCARFQYNGFIRP